MSERPGREGVAVFVQRQSCSNVKPDVNRSFVCVRVSERLLRQKEILEERAERRLEIFKNLVDNLSAAGAAAAVC